MDKIVEISRHIAASPDDVYAAISDVTRMGMWSEECRSVARGTRAVTARVVGATFDGHNEYGKHRAPRARSSKPNPAGPSPSSAP